MMEGERIFFAFEFTARHTKGRHSARRGRGGGGGPSQLGGDSMHGRCIDCRGEQAVGRSVSLL